MSVSTVEQWKDEGEIEAEFEDDAISESRQLPPGRMMVAVIVDTVCCYSMVVVACYLRPLAHERSVKQARRQMGADGMTKRKSTRMESNQLNDEGKKS